MILRVIEENRYLKTELQKQSEELKKTNASLTTVLGKLHETFNLLEYYGYDKKANKLANRPINITSRDITRLFEETI